MTHTQFHTDVRPLDCKGNKLQPLDFVIIGEIPEYYYAEEGVEALANYSGKYALVTYIDNDSPYYVKEKNWLGWINPRGNQVHVVSRRIGEGKLCEYDFWLDASTLTKIPYNYLLAAAFASYPIVLSDLDLGNHHFVVQGMEQFERIKSILQAPYDTLVKAQNEVAKFL
jgi:hypothetical protein